MNKKNAVEVRNIHKSFLYTRSKNNSLKRAITQVFKRKDQGAEDFYALNGISFNVEKGDFFGILGRNGSGKSTLLKIISEIYQPTSGRVKHDGKLVSFIELGVGFKAELTGRENVYLNGALLGFSKKEIDEMYKDIVEFAELEKFMDQQLKNYSSGMKVRLAFSVAIRSHADILILDEVLAVGDAAFQRKCNEYFRTLRDNHKTVILVTHGMEAVREFCNKAIVIENGKIIYEGSAQEAANEYTALFNPTDQKGKTTNKNRWGNDWATIDNISVENKNGKLSIDALIKSNNHVIDEFTFGYRFLNSDKKVIAAGNSQVVNNGQDLKLKKNEKVRIHFEMPDFLGNDIYTLSATVRLNDKTTVCDNWESAVEVKSSKPGTFYSVWSPATLKVDYESEK